MTEEGYMIWFIMAFYIIGKPIIFKILDKVGKINA